MNFSENFKYHNMGFDEDRNMKVIHVLSIPERYKAAFLFFIWTDEKTQEQGPGFIVPPGLTDEEAKELSGEFLKLFGKFSKAAEERKKNEAKK